MNIKQSTRQKFATAGGFLDPDHPPRHRALIRNALDEPARTLTCWGECTGSRRELLGGLEAHQGQFLSAHVGSKPEGTDLPSFELAARKPSPVYRNSAKAVGQFRPIEACKHPRTPRCR